MKRSPATTTESPAPMPTRRQQVALDRLRARNPAHQVLSGFEGPRLYVYLRGGERWAECFELRPSGEPGPRSLLFPGGRVELRPPAIPSQLRGQASALRPSVAAIVVALFAVMVLGWPVPLGAGLAMLIVWLIVAGE